MEIKKEGDKRYQEGIYDAAMGKYEEANRVDHSNEYVLGNIGLVHLKKREYQECVDMTSQALDRIEGFMNDTRAFSKDNRFEVKLLLRRATAYERLGQIELAKKDLDTCVRLEPQNKEA
jgi:tetratricopeptide (TPR) repeat protein